MPCSDEWYKNEIEKRGEFKSLSYFADQSSKVWNVGVDMVRNGKIDLFGSYECKNV